MTGAQELKVALVVWAAFCTVACGAFVAAWVWYWLQDRRRSRRRGGGLPESVFRRIGRPS